ncbi:hypothetical protein NQ176_g2997 [Zarea fungicola]|uniref:Uncharacterized protein n=1 Tax=Zarea fungicola TaxID=93591 RepID=A0ACC1NKL0_9HYPO|nr:hypothetical protein NQ176_g2997 [Lecanicillium fungicola]
MAAPTTWRSLRLSGAGNVPPLLVAFDTKASEYSIQITDMANVWKESIGRKAICIRAWGENTSIDPSDTPENMTQFLQTLRSALDETVSGHDLTSVTLSRGSVADSGEDGLKLVASCKLAGFEPLNWPFHLTRGSSVAVAAEFAIPLVATLYARSCQVDMLLEALKHKDSVIAKLADKLEATGTGLEHVFTALSGRKKVTREAADDKIKGLAPFDECKMNAEFRNNTDQPNDATDLIQRVFASTSTLAESSVTFEAASLDGWWRGFNSTSSLPNRSAAKAAENDATSEAVASSSPPAAKDFGMTDAPDDDDDGDDGEFQMQSTPPRLKSKHNDAHKTSRQPSPRRQLVKEENSSSQGQKKTSSRLGSIGGGKKEELPPPPRSLSPPARPNNAPASVDDDETASETASDVDETASLPGETASSPPAHRAVPSPMKHSTKRGGMGRIGGGQPKAPPVRDAAASVNAKKTTSPTDKAPPPASAAETSAPSSEAAPKRFGVIGKRIGGGTSTSGDSTTVDDTLRGRGTPRNASAETKRETSQERADRKREELKKELEKKAAAGPAKKKRRF